MELINKKDALHAILHNDGQAAVAAVENIKPVDMVDDYPIRDLIIFAELCRESGVKKQDLERVSKDATWEAKTVYEATERAFKEIVYNKTEDGITAQFKVFLPPPINPERYMAIRGVRTLKIPEINTEDWTKYTRERGNTDE